MNFAKKKFSSLGRFEQCESEWREPDRYRDLLTMSPARKHIARGAGLSLSGASFGTDSLVTSMRRFNRILAFDRGKKSIRAEAGVSLGKLHEYLAPQGFYLPVQPGYPDITLGGCIAGNVHGKNQYREGDFAGCVQEIELFHPARGILTLTPAENTELFNLTCGGYGLTGVILSAVIGVTEFPGGRAYISNIPTTGLRDTVETLLEIRDDYDFLYSWNEMSGARSTTGFVRAGNFQNDTRGGLGPMRHKKLDPMRPVPAINLFNRLILPPLNGLYAAFIHHLKKSETVDALDVFFPFATLPSYFHAYGRNGFLEHQVLIPSDAVAGYLRAFEQVHEKFRIPLGLATFKLFRGQQKHLRFTGDGISFAFHAPHTSNLDAFMTEVDSLDVDHGAFANLIKDSRISANIARKQYPDYDSYRENLLAHDPRRLFASALSRRLNL